MVKFGFIMILMPTNCTVPVSVFQLNSW